MSVVRTYVYTVYMNVRVVLGKCVLQKDSRRRFLYGSILVSISVSRAPDSTDTINMSTVQYVQYVLMHMDMFTNSSHFL